MFYIGFNKNLMNILTDCKYFVKFIMDMVYLRFGFHSRIRFFKTLK
jgi:hypothetical protein